MKNLLKLTLILSFVFTFNFNTFGQQQFGIKVSGGLSKITSSAELNFDTPSVPFKLSGQAGLYYDLSLGKKSSLGAELLFSQLEGKQTYELDYKKLDVAYLENVANLEGYNSNIMYEHISYFSLPVYYGYKIDRLTINGGFQISYAFSGSGRYNSSYVLTIIAEEGDPLTRTGGLYYELNNLDFKYFNFGPRAGVFYQLTNKLSIEGMYYYGLNNISKSKVSNRELKVQQMTIGIRYALWSKEDSK